MRFINKPITVETLQGQPIKVLWKNQIILVKEVLEHWRDTGCWWEKEAEKDFFRILCINKNLLEIFYDQQKEIWYLYKVYD